MAEYIDRGKFLKECMKTFGNMGVTIKAIEGIANECTADVVEVRHGEAIYDDHDEWWGAVYWCSLCGEKWMLESASYKAHYCPYCGARMDGERKEQK